MFGTTTVVNSNHKFRFLIRKFTRDGRFVLGNFPVGPGDYEVQYEKIVLEEHLSKLKRSEVEQYILIRQKEMLEAPEESDHDIHSQQLKAVELARAAVALRNQLDVSPPGHNASNPEPALEQCQRREETSGGMILVRNQSPHVHGANDDSVDDQAAPHRKLPAERQPAKSMNNLNKTCEAQQEAMNQQPVTSPRLEATASESYLTSDNVKIHGGVKYTRRHNGIFEGKYVGPPQLLSIDGEDYVEYRVLTKPTTF